MCAEEEMERREMKRGRKVPVRCQGGLRKGQQERQARKGMSGPQRAVGIKNLEDILEGNEPDKICAKDLLGPWV